MNNEIFEIVKESLTMEQVLDRYGYHVNRHKCICPFHNDSKPSMQVYPKSFYCFTCQTGGDLITFVAKLKGLKNIDAVKELNFIFNLNLDLGHSEFKPDMSKIEEMKQKKKEETLRQSYALKVWAMAQWLSDKASTRLICEIAEHSADETDYFLSEGVGDYVINRYKLYHG